MAQANYPTDKVRALQRTLYVAAKRDGQRRFHALYDRIARPDVLDRVWQKVRSNKGAAGIDGETIADIEAMGEQKMLEELRELLVTGRYRPQAVRRVHIPKPRPTFLTPVDDSLRPRLESTTIRVRLLFPGGRGQPRSMWRAWLGFNVSNGLGLLTIGAVLLSLALHDFSVIRDVAVILPMTIVVSAAYLLASVRYWFYVPTLIFATSLTCFLLSALSS
jgi:hypothetical protein